jgi:hypothetical protein
MGKVGQMCNLVKGDSAEINNGGKEGKLGCVQIREYCDRKRHDVPYCTSAEQPKKKTI